MAGLSLGDLAGDQWPQSCIFLSCLGVCAFPKAPLCPLSGLGRGGIFMVVGTLAQVSSVHLGTVTEMPGGLVVDGVLLY